jgi:hypothetical protein
LRSSLLQLGFQNSTADSSLFIYRHNSVTCYVLVYVDDLVITGMLLLLSVLGFP